jgi:hypothetical protein
MKLVAFIWDAGTDKGSIYSRFESFCLVLDYRTDFRAFDMAPIAINELSHEVNHLIPKSTPEECELSGMTELQSLTTLLASEELGPVCQPGLHRWQPDIEAQHFSSRR